MGRSAKIPEAISVGARGIGGWCLLLAALFLIVATLGVQVDSEDTALLDVVNEEKRVSVDRQDHVAPTELADANTGRVTKKKKAVKKKKNAAKKKVVKKKDKNKKAAKKKAVK